MKNFLAPVMQNKVVNAITSNVGKFYIAHESAILTGGTIGFSIATTAVTYHNSDKIHYILREAAKMLNVCENDDQKKQVYTSTLKQLAPLVTPILIFQASTIGCAVFAKKQSDKRIAELAGALTVAQQAVSYYQTFQKEAEEALGEKKYEKLQNDIYKNQEVDGRRFTAIASEGAPGEVLIIDKYSGRPFWCTTDRIENAAREYSRRLTPSGGYDQQSINDLYELIGNSDLTPTDLGEKFGHIADYDFNSQEVSAHFVDTHYVFPNGTRIPAFEMYLYPEPAYIDMGC